MPAVQGTLKSLLQHHGSKASILLCSAFFMVQLTSIHVYWKNYSFDQMDLCWQCNVSAFYVLSRFVIAFLPRSKSLLNSGLQSPSAVILELKKIKSLTVNQLQHLIYQGKVFLRAAQYCSSDEGTIELNEPISSLPFQIMV